MLDDTAEKIDAIITSQELFTRARYCYPINYFDYDRLYLSGKLRSLTAGRNNTSILLGGSSYAMVGLRERLMPRPAANLAVNVNDFQDYDHLNNQGADKLSKNVAGLV